MWNSHLIASQGVIIGADKTQEWMLGWWYAHYKKYCDYPIAICDFGLSKNGLTKAKQIGTVLDFDKTSLLKLFNKTLCPKKETSWQELYSGKLQNIHPIWMLKPFGLAHTPFEKTIWIDLDCQIQGKLDDIFSFIDNSTGFTIVPEMPDYQSLLESKGYLLPGEIVYNSGVIGYKQGCKIIDLWKDEVLSHHTNYLGDQDALSRIIHRHRLPVHRMRMGYNARLRHAQDPSTVIVHYVHLWGKKYILEQMLLNTKN